MLQKKTNYRIAVVGASAVTGREIVDILAERNFPVSDLVLLDREDAAGERIEFQGKSRTVTIVDKDSFAGVDIALFTGAPAVSREFRDAAVRSGAVVIDDSGAFAMDPEVQLVVPEVNPHVLSRHRGTVASPGAAAVAAAIALKPLHDAVTIKRLVITLFLSVSASGKPGMDELAQQTVALLNFRDVEIKQFPYQIAFNCLPQSGLFSENGSTGEEERLMREIRRILEDDSIRIAVTAVQVPVFRGHSLSINIECAKPATANEVRAVLSSGPGIVVYDDPHKNLYPTAIDSAGKDETFVGRIREDQSVPNGISLWIVADNLRKGSALNAVQIAELLIA